MKPIPYGRQDITAADEQAVLDVLRSDFLTQGPTVEAFELAFASYVGSRYAVCVANGTDALHLAVLVLGHKNKKVLTTPITFAASANSVLYCGGEVEFVDIDEKTYCIDPEALREKLRQRPQDYSGIIPVDYAGHPAALAEIKKIANEYGLWVIEDACHAPGALFEGLEGRAKCGDGTHADLAIFSFHPVKHIACGEGGMITTNDKKLYEKLKTLRTHGIVKDASRLTQNQGGWYHEMQDLGYNYRMPDILAALGLSQLKMAEARLARRREIALRYDRELNADFFQLPVVDKKYSHAYHLYVVQSPRRKELYDHLKAHQIFAQVHYLPVYQHPYWKSLKEWPACPRAERFYSRCLSIPMFPTLTPDQQSYVVETLNGFGKN